MTTLQPKSFGLRRNMKSADYRLLTVKNRTQSKSSWPDLGFPVPGSSRKFWRHETSRSYVGGGSQKPVNSAKVSQWLACTVYPLVASCIQEKTFLKILRDVVTDNCVLRQTWGLCGIIPPRSDLHLIDIVEGARRARAGDPRDKVYAMLNICPSSHNLGIEPDYALEIPAVHKLLAQRIVAAGQGHRLLLNCGVLGSALDLLSWVPDWSIENIPYNSVIAPWAAHGPHQHVESRTSESTIRLGKDSNELLVTVTGLGTVAYVEPLYTYERDPQYYVGTQLSSNDSNPNTVAGGSPVPDNPVNASANSLRTTCSGSNSDSDLSWNRYPKLFRLYATAFHLISESPVYKYTDHIRVVWKTLLCNHAGSLEGGQPDEYHDYAQSYYEFTKYIYSDAGGRAQYGKTVLDRIKAAHPKFAADTLTQQEVVEYNWRFHGYIGLQR